MIVKGLNEQQHLALLAFITLLLCAIIVAPEEEARGDSEQHAATVPAGNVSPTPRWLTTIADIPLPDTANRFDYQSYDPSRHRLFISHASLSEEAPNLWSMVASPSPENHFRANARDGS